MKTTIGAIGGVLVVVLALTACEESGGAFAEIAAPAIPGEPRPAGTEPGDPGVYAPPGWPVKIGDAVTHERRHELRDHFLSDIMGTALHVVGDTVYAARWAWPPLPETAEQWRLTDPASYRFGIYRGHFAVDPQPSYRRDHFESVLPKRFHDRIIYEHEQRPQPRYLHPPGQTVKVGRLSIPR